MLFDLNALENYRATTREEAYAIIDELETDFIIFTRKIQMKLIKLRTRLVEEFANTMIKLGKSVTDAFQVDSMADYVKATELFGSEFAGALYSLQLQFEQFRAGLIRIAQPIVQLLLPVAQVAVQVLSGLANALAQAVSWLFAGAGEADTFANSMLGAATATTSLKRTLAGFDQLNRLASGIAGGISGILTPPKLSDQWQKVADKLKKLMEPLRSIDFTPAAEAFQKLTQALEPLKRELFAGLEWAFNNLFVPLAKWTAEELLPVFLDTLRAALEALGRVVEGVKPMLTWLWEECLKPLAAWAGDQVIAYLQGIITQLTGVGNGAGQVRGPVDELIKSINTFLNALGKTVSMTSAWESSSFSLSGALTDMLKNTTAVSAPINALTSVVSGVSQVFGGLAEKFGLVDAASAETFANVNGTWSRLWTNLQQKLMDPTYSGMKSGLNGIIGLTNGMLKAAASGINSLARSVNKLSFTIPDWVPVLGGKKLGFDFQTVYPTQIPFLAQGAVLPANKPFMAVVGDQRHGTNVEAPLATIQEAVATVMDDQIAGVMAGFRAVTERQERLLHAVLGLELSDSAIAGAADRYRSKLAVITGGF